MEGVLANSLRPFTREGLHGLEFEAGPTFRVIAEAFTDTTRRRRARHPLPESWLPWDAVAHRIRALDRHINCENVLQFINNPMVVDISSDEEDDPVTSAAIVRLTDENTAIHRKFARTIATLVKKNARLQSRVAELEAPLVAADVLSCVLRGDEERYFTPRGGCSMAARRLATGVSSRRFGLQCNMDVSHQTVNRWEVIFTACIQAYRKAWYKDREAMLYKSPLEIVDPPNQDGRPEPERPPERRMRFAYHKVRGDATNTMKLKRKLHSAETRSHYFEIDCTDKTTWSELKASETISVAVGDLLEAQHQSALGAYTMYKKQVQSTGCPLRKRSAEQLKEATELARFILVSITFFFGADSGGDEDKNKKFVGADCEEDDGVFAWGAACLLHQYHLCVQRSLKMADLLCKVLAPAMNQPRKYFSSVVKIMHSWRDFRQKIFQHWVMLYGFASAVSCGFRRVPPLCLTGRWGAVFDAEGYVLKGDHAKLKRAIIAPGILALPAPAPKAKAKGKAKAKALLAPEAQAALGPQDPATEAAPEPYGTEELAIEATQAFTAKQGKWRTDASLAIDDSVFIPVIMRIANKAREPFRIFYAWMSKPSKTYSIDGDERTPGKIARLVWGKAQEFMDKLEALTHANVWASFFLVVPEDLRPALAEVIKQITWSHHADFHRRLMYNIVEKSPSRMLIIAKRGRDIECQDRLKYAISLLAADLGSLEINERKLRATHEDALLVVITSSGRCPGLLWLQVAIWCEDSAVPSETHYIEG